MRRLLLLTTLGFALAAGGADAATSASYPDRVVGAELPTATSTRGTFVGIATGALAERWRVEIEHLPLAITGGTFSLHGVDGRNLSGHVSGGTVTVRSPGAGCTDELYTVDAQLSAGRFTGTLTHHRRRLLDRCVIHAATISGNATFVG